MRGECCYCAYEIERKAERNRERNPAEYILECGQFRMVNMICFQSHNLNK